LTPRDITLVEGTPFTGSVARLTDADPNGTAGDYTASINWGDGQTTPGVVTADPAGGFDIIGTHAYAEEGTYAISVTVTDAGGSRASTGEFTWAAAPDLPTARRNLAAATGLDGRIYALGGDVDSTSSNGKAFLTAVSTVEAFDPVSNTWAAVASLPAARSALAAATVPGGHIYAIGGFDVAFNTVSTVEEYDPARNAWTPAASMPTPREFLAAVTGRDGRIYAIGGLDAAFNVVGTVEAYDPASNTWTTVAGLPTARYGLAAAVGPDGRIDAIGGFDAAGDAVNTVEAYDPASNTWTAVADLPTPNGLLAAALGSDGLIYALGGTANVVQVFDWGRNTWSTAAGLLTARSGLAAAAGRDGRIYAIGGSTLDGLISAAVESASTAHGSATVSDAPLAAAGGSVKATAGAPFTGVVASFTDADPAGMANHYTATILWGDGTTSPGTITPDSRGGFAVTGTTTYAAAGSYTVTVGIRDTGGSAVTATGTATVAVLGVNVKKGQTAGIGFWSSKNGQGLIGKFNGGPNSTALGNWLSGTFTNLYASLAGLTNTQVAAYYLSLFSGKGTNLEAEVLDTALAVYATTLSLGGTTAQTYGFTVGAYGLGASSWNVGANGAAFGVANKTVLNVYQILRAANKRAVSGVLYDGDKTLRDEALSGFDAINQAGGIGP
jgi:hypothetical protein